MKVAVIGPGGIGGYVGGRLAEVGEDVALIARGKHLEALARDGLRIETPEGTSHIKNLTIAADPAEIGPVDLILFTVKLADTESAASKLAPLIKDNTRIITLQNGVVGKDIIARHTEADRIAAGIIFMAAYIKEPGCIISPGGLTNILVDGMSGDPVIAQFLTSVEKAKELNAVSTEEPTKLIWSKFVPLAAFSGITSITRLPLGALRVSQTMQDFYGTLLEEGMAIAEASGVELGPEVLEKAWEVFNNQPGSQKSSMLVDIEAGKPTELQYLSGHMHALGQKLSVATPAHTAVWLALYPYKDGPPDLSEI